MASIFDASNAQIERKRNVLPALCPVELPADQHCWGGVSMEIVCAIPPIIFKKSHFDCAKK